MRTFLTTVTLVAASLAFTSASQADRGGENDRRPARRLQQSLPAQTPGSGRSGGPGRADQVSPVERVERVDRADRTERAIRGQSTPAAPKHDGGARPASVPAAAAPQVRATRAAQNRIGARELTRVERTETTPDHYYWHTENNTTYTHYYTGGYHWYGFYAGPTFYWTQYYGDYWWYYDPYGTRWVYWSNGFWWWHGPAGAYYVYLNDRYYPYEEYRGEAAIRRAYAKAPKDSTTISPDARRMAQILEPGAQAFLYDKTVSPPKFLMFLGSGVSKVRFTEGEDPARILIERKNGTFALFDADGNAQKMAAKKGDPIVAPEKPASIPPAPTSAPGK
jgi:hypothetical protein